MRVRKCSVNNFAGHVDTMERRPRINNEYEVEKFILYEVYHILYCNNDSNNGKVEGHGTWRRSGSISLWVNHHLP